MASYLLFPTRSDARCWRTQAHRHSGMNPGLSGFEVALQLCHFHFKCCPGDETGLSLWMLAVRLSFPPSESADQEMNTNIWRRRRGTHRRDRCRCLVFVSFFNNCTANIPISHSNIQLFGTFLNKCIHVPLLFTLPQFRLKFHATFYFYKLHVRGKYCIFYTNKCI